MTLTWSHFLSADLLGPSYAERQQIQEALKKFIDKADNKKILDLDPDLEYSIPSFHPLYRMNRSGNVRWDMIAEVIQTAPAGQDLSPARGYHFDHFYS